MDALPRTDPTGPHPEHPAGVWPPAHVVFTRGRGRTRVVLVLGVVVLFAGGVVLVVGRGSSGTAGAVVGLLIGGTVATGIAAALLVQWGRTGRALSNSPWRPVRVRLALTPAGKGIYDVVFDDGQLALANAAPFTGDLYRSDLLHTIGYATLPEAVDAFVAGDPANPSVLASRNGAVLIPLRGPRTLRQRRRWQHRWETRLDAAHQPVPQAWRPAQASRHV